MAWWEVNKIECANCQHTMKLLDRLTDRYSTHIFWCEDCGCYLKAYPAEPISWSDYKYCRLNKINYPY